MPECHTSCPIQAICQSKAEAAITAKDEIEELHSDIRNNIGDLMTEEPIIAAPLKHIYELSVPLAQSVYASSDHLVEIHQKMANNFSELCVGPVEIRRFIFFGNKVVRCTSLLQLAHSARAYLTRQ
jgi:hypothetical protein